MEVVDIRLGPPGQAKGTKGIAHVTAKMPPRVAQGKHANGTDCLFLVVRRNQAHVKPDAV